jgi:hypothetical protein
MAIIKLKIFTPPLGTDLKFFQRSFASQCIMYWPLSFQLPITVRGGALTLQGSHRIGAGQFAETPSASPFNKDLSNEASFSQIHLAG